MPELKLQLFGFPQFAYQGQPVEGVRRKALALTAYLALAERPRPRELLAGLLWSDQDEEHARAALRAVLHNLTTFAPVAWLEVDRHTVSLKADAVDIDVRQFLAALDRTRAHLHTDGKLCPSCCAALGEAVKLFGAPFLGRFNLPDSSEFDLWQSTQREWLSRECITSLRRLAQHTAEHVPGAILEAIAYGRKWLTIDPLDEQAHRLMMRLLAANGQRHEALKQYAECLRLLDRELATLPDAETIALYEALRDGEAVAAVEPGTRSFEPAQAISVLPPLPPLVIGRETAITELKARLGVPTPETRRSTTVIEGWPGVGKSTLFGVLAHDPELKAAFPDGILWTALGETPNLLRKLATWAEALRIIPPGRLPSLEALTGQITAALQDRRVLLLVDDIWQSDHAAPFRVGGQGCALLMSSRVSSVARALAPASADVCRIPVLNDQYALGLLSHLAPQAVAEHPEECLQLVHDLEGLPLAIQVAGRLLHEEMSLGWGVVELLAELRAGSSLLTAQAPDDTLATASYTAPTVLALLKRSTDVLDDETLTRFALLGLFSAKPATFDLAALAATWGVSDPKPTVRTLVSRGLLEPISGGRFQMHALLVLHARALLPRST
ncbi:MAG: hypothetical protein IAE80_23560 [Anaerolinea sp.]|nr:hypothetical protein [Anaerolinea sp.]